jgi:hypothetical protein
MCAAAAHCQPPPQRALHVVSHKQAGLGDTLVLKIDNWPDDKVDKWPDDKASPKNWVLFFDGVPVKGIHPDNTDFSNGRLEFYLFRNNADEQSKKTWSTLLHGCSFYREVTVALGPESGPDTTIAPAEHFQLIVVPRRAFGWYCIFLGCLIAGVGAMAWWSDVLRDRDTNPGSGRRPFSLGRCQMAWWFVLILASYLYIGLVNWDYLNTIATSALALMGISAGTALGAVLIDSGKESQTDALKAEKAALTAQIGDLPPLIVAASPSDQVALKDELSVKTARLAEVNRLIAVLPTMTHQSKNVIEDLISDANGISLHRFQIFVWTIVLGVVFIGSVIRELTMPEFGATLLALMGISSGTYLGFKFPEKKA